MINLSKQWVFDILYLTVCVLHGNTFLWPLHFSFPFYYTLHDRYNMYVKSVYTCTSFVRNEYFSYEDIFIIAAFYYYFIHFQWGDITDLLTHLFVLDINETSPPHTYSHPDRPFNFIWLIRFDGHYESSRVKWIFSPGPSLDLYKYLIRALNHFAIGKKWKAFQCVED